MQENFFSTIGRCSVIFYSTLFDKVVWYFVQISYEYTNTFTVHVEMQISQLVSPVNYFFLHYMTLQTLQAMTWSRDQTPFMMPLCIQGP